MNINRTNGEPRRLKDTLVILFSELEQALTLENRKDLLEQLPNLTLERWTHDPSCDAAYLYVAGTRPLNIVEANVIGHSHGESIPLKGCKGGIVVDTDNFGRISGIELLDRPDVVEAISVQVPYLER